MLDPVSSCQGYETFLAYSLPKEITDRNSQMFMAHIIPDFHLIDSQKRVSECGFRTFSCAHLTRFKLRTSYLPKASHTVQSFDPATSQTWKDTVFSRLTLQINVLFRLRIGRCRMDGIRYYRTTSNLL
jgi:hypothetical protein